MLGVHGVIPKAARKQDPSELNFMRKESENSILLGCDVFDNSLELLSILLELASRHGRIPRVAGAWLGTGQEARERSIPAFHFRHQPFLDMTST